MSQQPTREELLATAQRLRDQAKRLRQSAEYADSGKVRMDDLNTADGLVRKAEQMEKEAANASL